MANDEGMTRLTLVGGAARTLPPQERLLQTLRQELATQFEIYGELGRGDKGKVVFLARELATKHLVALQLVPAEDAISGEDFFVEVLRRLDATVPSSVDSECPSCHGALRGWGRFCRHCGADLSGATPGAGADRDALLSAVQDSTRGRYELLGEMDRKEGGGVVYFAREVGSGKIAALRLVRATAPDGEEEYSIGVTQVLGKLAASLGASPEGTPRPAVVTPPPRAPYTPAVTPPPQPPIDLAPDGDRGPTPVPQPDDSSRKTMYIVGGGVVAAALLAWGISSRSAPKPPPVAIDTTPPPIVVAPDSADIQLAANLPKGATVTVDGAKISGPTHVRAGTHELKVTAAGYTTVTQSIELKKNQTLLWSPVLAREIAQGGTRPTDRPTIPNKGTDRPPRDKGGAKQAPIDTTTPIQHRPSNDVPAAAGGTSCASLVARLEWVRALKPCQDEAGNGSFVAQRTLATMYERGLGTDVNKGSAATWYRKAADGGDAFAQYRLGALYLDGSGVKKDERAAMDWFRRASDQGQTDALMALAHALERADGAKRDKPAAFKLYLKAAELGDARGQFKVASLFAIGEITGKDEKQAFDWFKRAADQGYAEAQYRLGDVYRRGVGTAMSEPDAQKWFAKAAAQGHEEAKKALKK